MRYTLPQIDTMYDEFLLVEKMEVRGRSQPLPFKKVLTLEQLSFNYPSTVSPALEQVNISIPYGASIGFIGGSGAGKSTLVDIILGLLTPGSGEVKVDGVDIQTSLRGWQDQIGYVPQSIFLTDDTLRSNIAFGLTTDQIDELAVSHAVRAAQLEDFINELPDGLDTMVGEHGVRISGGQRQRIGIARALYHDPSVLVLDEATSSLDTATEKDVMSSVYALQGDKTILIVAHRLSTVEDCDQLFRLEHGKVVDSGGTAEMLSRAHKKNKHEKA
jgi:ABC-type multidrug transport system fused ATPase/permease subunit